MPHSPPATFSQTPNTAPHPSLRLKGPRAFLDIANVYRGKLAQPQGEKQEDLQEMPTDSSYSRPSDVAEGNGEEVGMEMFEFEDSSRPSYHTRATIQTDQKEPSCRTIPIGIAAHSTPQTLQLFPLEDG